MWQAISNPLRHVLCLGAHADDIEIGCGGTLLRMLAQIPNLRLTWVVFSAAEQRAAEARTAALSFSRTGGQTSVVNISIDRPSQGSFGSEPVQAENLDLRILDFPDRHFPAVWSDLKQTFADLADDLRLLPPDLIFSHRRDDRHQDHRVIAELTWQTFRQHLIWEYEIPKYEGDWGKPNVYIPLDPDIVEAKCKLLVESFPSQGGKHWFDKETFCSILRLRGIESGNGVRYAEAFEVRKLVIRNPVEVS